MRIGINTGEAVVGNFGSHTRFDYTMLGDSVNICSRLEGLNKQFGTGIMISEFTKKIVGDIYSYRELGRITLLGKQKHIVIYEPIETSEYLLHEDRYNTFDRGLREFYLGHFEAAIIEFEKIKQIDKPASSYIEKCNELIDTPPGNWSGVWKMLVK